MLRNLLSLTLVVFICFGCVPTTTVTIQDAPNLKSKLYDGQATKISKKKRTEVAVISEAIGVPNEGHFEIAVIATNTRASAMLFSTENISVKINGEAAQVETYEERKKQEETEAAWAAVAVALGGAAQAYSASIHNIPTVRITRMEVVTGAIQAQRITQPHLPRLLPLTQIQWHKAPNKLNLKPTWQV